MSYVRDSPAYQARESDSYSVHGTFRIRSSASVYHYLVHTDTFNVTVNFLTSLIVIKHAYFQIVFDLDV